MDSYDSKSAERVGRSLSPRSRQGMNPVQAFTFFLAMCPAGLAVLVLIEIYSFQAPKLVSPAQVEVKQVRLTRKRVNIEPLVDAPNLASSLTHLVQGMVVFNPPDKMFVGQKAEMEVRISRGAIKKVSETLRGDGSVESHDIEVGQFMGLVRRNRGCSTMAPPPTIQNISKPRRASSESRRPVPATVVGALAFGAASEITE
jgi:hypothetical protein